MSPPTSDAQTTATDRDVDIPAEGPAPILLASRSFDGGTDVVVVPPEEVIAATMHKTTGDSYKSELVARGKSLGYWRGKSDDKEFVAVSGLVEHVALVINVENGAVSRLMRVYGSEGTRRVLISNADFHASPAAVFARLAEVGLYIAPDREKKAKLLEHLLAVDPGHRIYNVDKPGWTMIDGESLFVTSAATVGPREVARHVALAESKRRPAFCRGELGWRDSVAALCKGNSRCTFAVSFALGSLLLPHLAMESGGVNFYGHSLTGKTTLLRLASSVFGGPEYMQRCRATANGLEAVAADHNHCALVLDEIGQLDSREAGPMVYMLGNGRGKLRAGRAGSSVVTPCTWQLHWICAGETGLADFMSETGKQIKAGQEVRMLDIEACPEDGHGVYECVHSYPSGAELSKEIGRQTAKSFGRLNLEFARFLIENPKWLGPELRRRHASTAEHLVAQIGSAEGVVGRAADRFAIAALAGELATEAGMTGWDGGDATWAAFECFRSWLGGRLKTQDTGDDPVQATRDFIHTAATRFQDLSDPDSTVPRDQVGWIIPAGNAATCDHGEYHVISSVLNKEVLARLGRNRALQALRASGFLLCGGEADGHYTVRRRHGDRWDRVYAFSAQLMDGLPSSPVKFERPI